MNLTETGEFFLTDTVFFARRGLIRPPEPGSVFALSVYLPGLSPDTDRVPSTLSTLTYPLGPVTRILPLMLFGRTVILSVEPEAFVSAALDATCVAITGGVEANVPGTSRQQLITPADRDTLAMLFLLCGSTLTTRLVGQHLPRCPTNRYPWGYFSFQDLRQVSGFQRSLNPGLGLVRTMTLTRTAS